MPFLPRLKKRALENTKPEPPWARLAAYPPEPIGIDNGRRARKGTRKERGRNAKGTGRLENYEHVQSVILLGGHQESPPGLLTATVWAPPEFDGREPGNAKGAGPRTAPSIQGQTASVQRGMKQCKPFITKRISDTQALGNVGPRQEQSPSGAIVRLRALRPASVQRPPASVCILST